MIHGHIDGGTVAPRLVLCTIHNILWMGSGNCLDSYHHNRVDHYMLKTQECKSSVSSKHVSAWTKRLSRGTGSRHVLPLRAV